MTATPLHIDGSQRIALAAFEHLYEAWALANAAAEAAERELAGRVRSLELGLGAGPDAACVQQALELTAEAGRLQQQALQLLRDAPI